jgi:hypothetical protein
MRLSDPGRAPLLVEENIPQPQPGRGEGSSQSSPGFPPNARGNDGLRKRNQLNAASCGELDPRGLKTNHFQIS